MRGIGRSVLTTDLDVSSSIKQVMTYGTNNIYPLLTLNPLFHYIMLYCHCFTIARQFYLLRECWGISG